MTESLPIENHWKKDQRQSQRCIFDSFRPIARRQIGIWYKKMKAIGKKTVYLEKIKEIALDELNRLKSSDRIQDHKNRITSQI